MKWKISTTCELASLLARFAMKCNCHMIRHGSIRVADRRVNCSYDVIHWTLFTPRRGRWRHLLVLSELVRNKRVRLLERCLINGLICWWSEWKRRGHQILQHILRCSTFIVENKRNNAAGAFMFLNEFIWELLKSDELLVAFLVPRNSYLCHAQFKGHEFKLEFLG